MCHLVNALQQLGLLKPFGVVLGEVIELHDQLLFAETITTKLEDLLSRLLPEIGASRKTIGNFKIQRLSDKASTCLRWSSICYVQEVAEHDHVCIIMGYLWQVQGTEKKLVKALHKLGRDMVRLQRGGVSHLS